MNRGDLLVVAFVLVLVVGILYLYSNMESFECYVNHLTGSAMSGIDYDFEPNGSLYGKTEIYRFTISSDSGSLDYFGMSVVDGSGKKVFFENRTTPNGGSIVATINLNGTENNMTVKRFFKKKCFEEVVL